MPQWPACMQQKTPDMKENKITTLFLDIGGVLLSNGWGHESRRAAAEFFHLDYDELQARHKLLMGIYEEGKLSISAYLDQVIFYEERPFSADEFQAFMFGCTTPHEDMIALIRQLKMKYHLKIGVVNNEAKELNEYRIRKFKFNEFVDFYISSCYVHMRKPDPDMFRLALDISQVLPQHILYLEDEMMHVSTAKSLGINGIKHNNFLNTSNELAGFGLVVD